MAWLRLIPDSFLPIDDIGLVRDRDLTPAVVAPPPFTADWGRDFGPLADWGRCLSIGVACMARVSEREGLGRWLFMVELLLLMDSWVESGRESSQDMLSSYSSSSSSGTWSEMLGMQESGCSDGKIDCND